jgi:hypothetical protein
MGHPSDDAQGNALDHGFNLTSRDLLAASDYYVACNACLEGKMTADPQKRSEREPVREIGEHVPVDLIPAKRPSLGGNMHLMVSRGRLSSYFMYYPIKTKETENVLARLLCIKNFYESGLPDRL